MENKIAITSIKIQVNDRIVELTTEEAREVKRELDRILETDKCGGSIPTVPYYVPYPVYPAALPYWLKYPGEYGVIIS